MDAYSRDRFLRTFTQMKKHFNSDLIGTADNLFDCFVSIHFKTPNIHSNGLFGFAHRLLLHLIESAVVYTAQVDGDKMNPKVTREESCEMALPYFEWDKYVDDDLYEADLWSATGIGSVRTNPNSPDPVTGYYVTDGLFKDWTLKYCSCYETDVTKPGGNCKSDCTDGLGDKKLKRYFYSGLLPSQSPTQIADAILKKPTALDFAVYLSSALHNAIHKFIGFSMTKTETAGDDPIFWMHHCNVDRFLALWQNCHRYDILDPMVDLKPDIHFHGTMKVGVTQTLDTIIELKAESTRNKFLTLDFKPTSRDAWFMGDETKTGWQGMYYRYGYDNLASNPISSACPTVKSGSGWSWVNQGTKPTLLKREALTTDPGELLYENITKTFIELTEEKGMSPREALDKMVWDDCVARPFKITPYERGVLRSLGISLKSLMRVCDKEEDFPKDEGEVWHHHM
jgi:hypothetical protein